ncbi:DUF6233 domain-containing protein [Streptomyces candidus]|uniref:Uncharacterized protein n=1 Tax=Streptomyces candidus TaxID=67283 RepID=A0A7X0HLS8_9ACTN|nr:DUF6233 domain-containing protein [Streptomyces candidus]MBB6439901.1 hypothetical protein [Streptomyces candidus]GHH58054.1 hypothetical protein GCM10018773_66050 [Streptomyces candidus]
MSDLPPDLPRLLTLETWHAMQLERIRAAIRVAEETEVSRRREEERLAQPPPEWLAEPSPAGGPGTVHCGYCGFHGGRVRGIGVDAARRALVEGAEACPACRPDTALGLLD